MKTSLSAKYPETIVLWKGKSLVVKAAESIAGCFVAKGERVVKVMAEGTIYQVHGSLNDFVTKIGTDLLLRCHRSYYLNPRCLTSLEHAEDRTMRAYLK